MTNKTGAQVYELFVVNTHSSNLVTINLWHLIILQTTILKLTNEREHPRRQVRQNNMAPLPGLSISKVSKYQNNHMLYEREQNFHKHIFSKFRNWAWAYFPPPNRSILVEKYGCIALSNHVNHSLFR